MTRQRLLLVALVVLAFAPALRGEFLHWDDLDHVIQNSRVVDADGLVKSWLETGPPGFYPITYTTFWLEWRLAGGRPWLFHLDNVLLHAGSAVLVTLLCAHLGLGATTSWLVAALWAVHPLQVASVAWIAERKNVLYVFLYLLSLLLYLRAEERASRRQRVAYVLSVVLFACALLSKGAAMTLPAAVVLVRWARGRPLDRDFWLSLVPYGAVAAGAGLALLSSVPAEMRTPSLAARLALAPYALWFYVRAFFWPTGLLPIYPRWPLDAPGPGGYLPWLVVAAACATLVALRDRLPRAVVAGVGFFLVNVVLVIGVVWFTFLGHSPVGDHLSYLPNLGLALATVAGIERLAGMAAVPRPAVAAGLALWCAALGIASWRYIPVWHDTDGLWRYTLARNPECALCHYNLGVVLEERGDRDAAAEHYEAAMRIAPDAEAAINLGNARLAAGRVDDAVALYRRAVQLDGTNEKAYLNLGLVSAGQGRTEEAIAHYRSALRVAPRSVAARRGLGEALRAAGNDAEGRKQIEEALRLAPGDAENARALARIAVEAEDWKKAVGYYEQALRTRAPPASEARTHRELAEVLDQLGRNDGALFHYGAAHRLAPDDPDTTIDLATALVARKRAEEAAGLLSEALARAPASAPLASSLAWIRATSPDAGARDAAEAVRLAEQACSLSGYGDPDKLDTLAAAYAEAGRFADALRTARQALSAAEDGSDLADGLRERIALYEAGRPYRVP